MSALLSLLGGLTEAGCDVTLLCLGEGGLAQAARDQGLSVTVLPMRGAGDPRVLRPLARHLHSSEGWDVVHTHGMRANLPVRLLLGARRLRRRGRPCLCQTVHSDLALDYPPARARAYLLLDRATLPVVDRFLCVSEDLRRRLLARGHSPRTLVTVHSGPAGPAPSAPNGAPGGGRSGPDSASVGSAPALAGRGATAATGAAGCDSAPPVAPGPSPAALPPADGSPWIGTVGRLQPVKDLDLLVEVTARVRRDYPGVRALIVGDGPERPALQARAAQLGPAEAVLFTGDLRPAAPAFRRLAVYLVTSLSEGIPMSVLEAMQAGLPVVGTRVGGLPEVVEEGVTGFLVDRQRPRDELASLLAERVGRLLSDRELRTRMSLAARARVHTEFSVAVAARRTLAVYRRCLAERDPAGAGSDRAA